MIDSTILEPTVTRIRSLTKGWPDDLLDSRHPAFLCRQELDGRATWYAIAHTARQAREVREYALAFVGPSYSDFTGQPAQWDCADSVEAEFANVGLNGFRLVVPSADASTVSGLLTRLRQLLRDRPRRVPAEPPSLARLLRDFELLIRAHDSPAATAALDQLRARGQLTASQLSGLQVRWLASQQRWAEILAFPELPVLLAQRLPTGVSEAIAVAVYREQLARFATEADAAAYYREHVAPVFGQLFRQRTAWRDADAVKAGQIADAATRPVVPVSPLTDPYSTALAAHRANDPATAFHLLVAGPFTAESVRLLVEVAVDLGTFVTARLAVAAVRGCTSAIRESALARRASRSLWRELQDIAGGEDEAGAPVQDWLTWLSRAGSGPWPNAAEVAARGAKEWPRPDAAKFTAAFTEHANQAFPVLRDALPALLEMLLPDQQADPAFGSVYRGLLERVAFDDELSPNDAAAVLELAAAVLHSNPVANATRNDYALVIENLLIAWQQLKRPTLLDWGLDLLDLAAEHAIHRQTSVSQFVLDVVGEFARVPRLVTSAQRELLRTLCAELDMAGAADALVAPKVKLGVVTDESVIRKRLGNRTVVLLTLGDRIAAMFRTLMHQRFPDARTEVIQEYAGTKRLRDVAVSADIFIVNTYDAKHAATGFVSQCRSQDRVTLYPKGKNAARQMDALEEWLRS